ncbi:MAG: hypothetical protein HFJ20_01905 [Clostridia bacterium]|nr:hypothetical protein [Clostridia bacterium]
MKYPPFCDIIMLGVTSEDEIEVKKISNLLYNFFKEKILKENAKILLYKPVPSPIEKIKNKYRWRIIIKCKFGNDIIMLVNDALNEFSKMKKKDSSKVIIELNPNNML